MTCDDFRSRLTAFSLGELEPEERQQAREHVAGCDACAAGVLLDRQLTALVRASVAPAPAPVRDAVRAALRADVERQAGQASSRRRHWLALGTAALAAAAVLAAAVLLVPAPDPGSPLAAAWRSYHREPIAAGAAPGRQVAERLQVVLGPAARTPDLGAFGLQVTGWDARELAGHLAAAAEYRDDAGGRVSLMRWRGELPHMARAPDGDGQELEVYRWGRHGSAWWREDGIVWCLIGTVDQPTLYQIAEHLSGES
jgi:anti-sigma factor RsiW